MLLGQVMGDQLVHDPRCTSPVAGSITVFGGYAAADAVFQGLNDLAVAGDVIHLQAADPFAPAGSKQSISRTITS